MDGGHKRIVLFGLALFGLSSVLCDLAPDVETLVVGRVLQGVGAALLLSGTLAIISRAFPDRAEQAKAIGISAGIGSLALPAGPLLGGALVSGLGWRSIFLLNAPIVAVALVASAWAVPESVEPTSRGLDLAGVVLGALVLLAITFAFIEGGHAGPGSPAVIVALVAAMVALTAFVVAEAQAGEDAMLPLGLFRRPLFSVANGTAGVMNLGTLGALFVLTLFLQSSQRDSPLVAGLAMVPLFAPLAVIAPLAGRLTSRIGPRLPMAGGLLISSAGLGLLVAAGSHSTYAVMLVAFLLWGGGLGLLTPTVVAAAIASVPKERSGLASAINNTSRQAAGAVGIAVAGAIAGQPTNAGGFISGFHLVVVGAACLYVLTAIVDLAVVPGALLPGAPRRT